MMAMAVSSEDVWFARVPGRGKMVPINARGWQVVWRFVAGMAGSAILAFVLISTGPMWLGVAAAAIGMAASGFYFVFTATRHTDHSKTLDDYRQGPSGSGKTL